MMSDNARQVGEHVGTGQVADLAMDFDTLKVVIGIRERLVRAAVELNGLCAKAALAHNLSEYGRLDGKAEGIRLALSYVEEEIRAR